MGLTFSGSAKRLSGNAGGSTEEGGKEQGGRGRGGWMEALLCLDEGQAGGLVLSPVLLLMPWRGGCI